MSVEDLTRQQIYQCAYISLLEERLSEREINDARRELQDIGHNVGVVAAILGNGHEAHFGREPGDWQ